MDPAVCSMTVFQTESPENDGQAIETQEMNLHHLKMEVKDEDPTGNESLNQGKTEHLLFSDSQEGEEEVMKSGIHITPFPREVTLTGQSSHDFALILDLFHLLHDYRSTSCSGKSLLCSQNMSGARSSKRNSAREIINKASTSTLVVGYECLPLSPCQLREIWAYDNMRGSQTMGAPLRSCSKKEKEEQHIQGTDLGISESEMHELKKMIDNMWDKAKTIFEIYQDPLKQELGYRMRVKESMPIKITLTADDAFHFGWCAVAPESSSCSHLYERSPVKPNGYMGGPASFLNWGPGKEATVKLSRPTNNIARYLVRLECSKLSGGVEMKWNYGCETEMPVRGVWFNECCSIVEKQIPTKRHQKKDRLVPFMNVESCVLCGLPYSCNNKERRIQRKPHFVNSHADFLGSSWTGLGTYMQQEVNGRAVLRNADSLNSLLHVLSKDLGWNVLPACKVFTMQEMNSYGEDQASLLQEFRKRCDMFKAGGTLVVRGMEAAASIEELTIEHLKPIPTSVWRVLTWKESSRLLLGHYSVPKDHSDHDHESAVHALITKFCLENWPAQ